MPTELRKMSGDGRKMNPPYVFSNFSADNTGAPDPERNVLSFWKYKEGLKHGRDATNTIQTRHQKILELISEFYDAPYSEPNWNGYEANPINKQSVKFAEQFLKSLPKEISLPDMDPNANGRLGLYWSKEGYQLLLDISSEGTISYAFKSKKGLAYTGRANFFNATPKRLNSLLQDYFSEF